MPDEKKAQQTIETQEAEEPKQSEIQEETTEEVQEEQPSETPSEELTEQEIIESKNLYRLLKNPQTARAVVAALASEHNLLNRESTTPATPRQEATARKEIKEIVEEALGPDYKFISGKLSTAIEDIIKQERASSQAQFVELQRASVERDVVSSYEALARTTKGDSKRFENRMAQLAEEIPIGSQDVRTYIERLYTIASGEKRSSPQKVADQIRRNASDAGARLPGSASAGPEVSKIPSKKMSLDESIQFAVDQQRRK